MCVQVLYTHAHTQRACIYIGIGVRTHLHIHMGTYMSFICFTHFGGNLVSNRFLMLLFLNRVFEKNLEPTEESMKHLKYVKLNVYFPCLGGKLCGFLY